MWFIYILIVVIYSSFFFSININKVIYYCITNITRLLHKTNVKRVLDKWLLIACLSKDIYYP